MRTLLNYFAFQIGWIACVTSAAYGAPSIGVAVALCIAAAHVFSTGHPGAETRLILMTAGIGAIWDSALVVGGFIHYPSGMLMTSLARRCGGHPSRRNSMLRSEGSRG